MGKNIVITIGRENGSGGKEIAEKLAAKLGIHYYDRNLIDMAAQKSGMNSAVLYQADEKASHLFFSSYVTSPGEYGTVNDRLFWTQSSIIKELAQKESCVIVGRCADYVLEDFTNCLHVFVYAPLESRIQRIMDRYMLESVDAAKREIARVDKQRRSYYQYYTDRKWGQYDGKNLVIDSSYFGVDKTVDLLAEIVTDRWPDYNRAEKEDDEK